MIAMVENVGFGGSFAAPAAKGVYLEYLKKKGFLPPTDQEAKNNSKFKGVQTTIDDSVI